MPKKGDIAVCGSCGRERKYYQGGRCPACYMRDYRLQRKAPGYKPQRYMTLKQRHKVIKETGTAYSSRSVHRVRQMTRRGEYAYWGVDPDTKEPLRMLGLKPRLPPGFPKKKVEFVRPKKKTKLDVAVEHALLLMQGGVELKPAVVRTAAAYSVPPKVLAVAVREALASTNSPTG